MRKISLHGRVQKRIQKRTNGGAHNSPQYVGEEVKCAQRALLGGLGRCPSRKFLEFRSSEMDSCAI